MDNKEKIIELLEKRNLTAAEKLELEGLISSSEELKAFAEKYQQFEKVVSNSSHLNEDELAQYILYKNGLESEDKSIIKRVPFIEQHLRKCSSCSDYWKELNAEYSDVDNFLTQSIQYKETASPDSKIDVQKVSTARYKSPRYAFASILIIGFVYLVLYIISSASTPAYFNDAAIKQDSQFSINRGRATEDFQNSLKSLEQKNYDEAINFLQKDIKANPDDETIFYSYYILGLSYLQTAEHNFLGLFPGYNQERAEKGARYLELSIQKNNSRKFENIKLNSYFYLAKASMMMDDKKSAAKYLDVVIREKGSKMEEAKILLGEME